MAKVTSFPDGTSVEIFRRGIFRYARIKAPNGAELLIGQHTDLKTFRFIESVLDSEAVHKEAIPAILSP